MEKRALIEKAETLISHAKFNAIGSLVPTLNNLPTLQINPALWDTAVTVAGIFIAQISLNKLHASEDIKNEIRGIIHNRAKEWDEFSLELLDDCKYKFNQDLERLSQLDSYKKESKFLLSDALGNWIAWNVLQHQPTTNEERELIRHIGGFVVHFMVDYWEI